MHQRGGISAASQPDQRDVGDSRTRCLLHRGSSVTLTRDDAEMKDGEVRTVLGYGSYNVSVSACRTAAEMGMLLRLQTICEWKLL